MGLEEVLEKLNENPKEVTQCIVKLLLKIAENIIKEPGNPKFQILPKANATFAKKIMPVKGAILCLKFMGFVENELCFYFPKEATLTPIHDVAGALLMWQESVNVSEMVPHTPGSSETKETNSVLENVEDIKPLLVKPVILPPVTFLFRNPFLHSVEVNFHRALHYKFKDVQQRARDLIPYQNLEAHATKRLSDYEKYKEKSESVDLNISIQEMFLLELLQWFKNDFFTWVDFPECDFCKGKTSYSHMTSIENNLGHFEDKLRVEIYKCESCHMLTKFPRYNDLNILLQTRKGRCGEWANTFTLFCRSMGWDARFVVDQGDHVWTEVYSNSQKRWLHCDPCENICDKPLIYENGWKKKISYVIAYSDEEVQDVTWRYSSNHKKVLKRRKKCTERELVDALVQLRTMRQKDFSEDRKSYLSSRVLSELVEMMVERKPDNQDNQGRQSGSMAWRLIRGEASEDLTQSDHVWIIDSDQIEKNFITLQYSTSKDIYVLNMNEMKELKKWNMGCFSHTNILRKEEQDWKQVYLARQDGKKDGCILWKFKVKNQRRKLSMIEVHFPSTVFENGNITAELISGDVIEQIPNDLQMLSTQKFAGKTDILLKVTLSGGKGDVSWQHAQLFRQSLTTEEYSFIINFIFH